MMETTKRQPGTLALAALLAGSCLLSTPAKADTAAGETIFKAKCAACHGPDGKGKPSMQNTDLTTADAQKKTDEDLSGVITNGKPPKMPPYKSLSADQVKDLVSYIRSLKK